MLGTVKSTVPELEELDEELVGCAEVVACAVAVTDGSTAAECTTVGESAGAGDDVGALVSTDVGESPGEPAKAADEPLGAPSADGAPEGLDELRPHAARPIPVRATAMITAGTRHRFMLQTLRYVTRNYIKSQ
jgi:hypothetical protein